LGSTPSTIGNSTINIDINKLKKRIQTLCERLEKGGSLVSSTPAAIIRHNSPDCMLISKDFILYKSFFCYFYSIASYGSTSLSTRREKPLITNHSNHKENEDEMPNGDDESKISSFIFKNNFIFKVHFVFYHRQILERIIIIMMMMMINRRISL